MECVVHRVPMRDPSDASEVLRLIDDGLIAPHEIVALLGKTEGNGCVNDFTRGYATMALSAALAKPLGITAEEVPSRVAIVMSGGTEGGLSPHFLVFAVRDRAAGPSGGKSLAIGAASTPVPLCCTDQQSGEVSPRIHFHVRRMYSGRPSSSMRFSEATAMATSVVCRPSVRERSASPITRL